MERFNNRTNGYHIFHNYYKKKKHENVFPSKIHTTFRWYRIIIASIYFSLYFNYRQFTYQNIYLLQIIILVPASLKHRRDISYSFNLSTALASNIHKAQINACA